jgi:hypothetical protein
MYITHLHFLNFYFYAVFFFGTANRNYIRDKKGHKICHKEHKLIISSHPQAIQEACLPETYGHRPKQKNSTGLKQNIIQQLVQELLK